MCSQKRRIVRFYLPVLCAMSIASVLVIYFRLNDRVYYRFFVHTNVDPMTSNVAVTDQTDHEVTTLPTAFQQNWEKIETNMFQMYILSVFGINNSLHVGYSAQVKLSGWTPLEQMQIPIKCCIKMKSDTLMEYYRPWRVRHKLRNLTATQTTCLIKSPLQEVKGVALQFTDKECPQNNNNTYLKPSPPMKATNIESFAICLKILYGQVDIPRLIEWIEYHRLIGVDKISMFTYGIAREVHEVLKQYVKVGFIEKRPFFYPNYKLYPVGVTTVNYYADEQVAAFDCHQRLSQFQYIAIIDLDEFIVPRMHDNVKDMLRYLMEKHPRAGGFRMPPFLFPKNKNVSPVKKNSTLGSYFLRTGNLTGWTARIKNIVLPSRVKAIETHLVYPSEGYDRIDLHESVVTLNHYRNKCYHEMRCKKPLIKDTYVLKFLNKLNDNKSNYV